MKAINSKTVQITKYDSENLKIYFKELRQIKLLDKIKEGELFFEYYNTRCPKIKQKLINNNLRFVLSVSKHYHNSEFYQLTDIISSGNIGLIKAIEEFDPTKGFKFSTYAVWWIRQAILEGIKKDSKLIKQPIKYHEVNTQYIKLKNEFYKKYGFEPNVEDIADDLLEKTSTEILAKSLSAIDDNNNISIHNTFNSSSDDLTYEDIIPSSIYNESSVYQSIDLQKINLNVLTKIQKLVIKYKFGFEDKPEKSFREIAEELMLSETDVIISYNNALKRLKNDI